MGLGQSGPAVATLTFEVASVRPSRPGSAQHANIPLDSGYVFGSIDPEDARSAQGGLVMATHQALWRYISFAYKLTGTQELALRFSIFAGVPKSGAPLWVTGSFDGSPEFFDISARAAPNTTIDEMRVMMQSLLAERFHLAVHLVSADTPVFALVLSKAGTTGPNLQVHPEGDVCAGPDKTPGAVARAEAVPVAVGKLPPACGVIAHVPSSEPGLHYGGRAVPLALLATTVPTMTGLAAMPRPVVDQTGLTGLYDFTLNWMHDASGDEAIADNTANFRNALKSQLGLELKPSRAAISFLMVDHVERPTEN